MSICPNCAIPVRDGARFCTSCGARIDGAAVAYVPPPAPAYVPAWDEQPAAPAPAWPAPPAANTWPGQEQPWGTQPEGWPTGGWQDPVNSLPFDPVAYAAIHGADELRVADEIAAAEDQWVSEGGSEEVFVAAEAPAPAPPSAPDWPVDFAPQDDVIGGVIVDRTFIDSPAPAAPIVTRIVSGTTIDAATARDRAAELLTELRDLLPRLANPSGADPVALATVLESGIASDRMRWSDLRAVMEAARDRPRDVETILALSQQVDAVLALLDRHEQLTDAVRRAARQLRGDA